MSDFHSQVSSHHVLSDTPALAESTSAAVQKCWNFLENKRVDVEQKLEDIEQETKRLAEDRAVLLEEKTKIIALLGQAQRSLEVASQVDETLSFLNAVQQLAIVGTPEQNIIHVGTKPDPAEEDHSIATQATIGSEKRRREDSEDIDARRVLASNPSQKRYKTMEPTPAPKELPCTLAEGHFARDDLCVLRDVVSRSTPARE